MKTYNQFIKEMKTAPKIMQEMLDDLPCTEEEFNDLLEIKKGKGNALGNILKIVAISMQNRLVTQAKKVISATTTDKKIDELARAISIAGGIASISIAVQDGSKSGLSKLIGLSALKN